MIFKKLFSSDEPEKPRKTSQKDKVSERQRTQTKRRHRVKVSVMDLRIGMMVVELDKPWEESSFMFQGLDIKSSKEILALQNECEYVYVDYDEHSIKKGSGNKQAAGGPAAGKPNNEALVSVEQEHSAAAKVHNLANETVSNLFEEIRLGGQIDGGKVKAAVDGCVDSILRNPDASVWLTRIQAKDEGTAQHSLNVAALSIVMGKSMNMSTRELEDIGVCAMLHDVGKTSLPNELINKKDKLTDEEYEQVKMHCRHGRDILLSTKSVMSGAADVAHSHHERPDGKGYPRGLDSDKIPRFAKIVAIAEAYDVITTKQNYREARSPSEALQELYAHRGTQFDEEFVIKFIDAVGIFPPGSIVEMVNGEIGIVLSSTQDKLRPKIILILDAQKEAAPQSVIDLSQMDIDSDGNIYQIKTTLSDGTYGINIEDFQRAGLRMG